MSRERYVCLSCGRDFYRYPSQARRHKTSGRYCSLKCRSDVQRRSGQLVPYVRYGHNREHIVFAERAMGKALPPKAVVHHVDGDGWNNGRDNLVICQDQAYHMELHRKARVQAAGGDPWKDRMCSTCLRPLRAESFYFKPSRRWSTDCKPCARAAALRRQRRSSAA